ncbi:MAG: phosphodiester glycosidase family protein [Acidaminococcaceae bacterium]
MKYKLSTLLLCLLLLLPWTLAEAAQVKNLRSSVSPDKTRLVLDLDTPTTYTVQRRGQEIIMDLAAATAKEYNLQLQDDLIGQVTLQKNGKRAKLTIKLLQEPTDYKPFLLKTPHRLVIDFNKLVRAKETLVLDQGVTYTSWRDVWRAKPVWLHIVALTPQSKYVVRPVLGQVENLQKGRLTTMATKTGALAMVNASYFDVTPWIIGNLKLREEWVASEFRARTTLALKADGTAQIFPQLAYQGSVTASGKTLPLTGVNRERLDGDLILYNSYYGARTGTNAFGVEVGVEKGVVAAVSTTGNMILRPGLTVLSGHGTSGQFLRRLRVGSKVKLTQTVGNHGAEQAQYLIGAGPLLVQDGSVRLLDQAEEFPADITKGRAPRTAVGIKADGTILLVVVDGRSKESAGLTLPDLAAYLLRLGAQEAMNFDGGGSSELVVKRDIMNSPSDGNERPVRVGLGVFRR